MARLQVRVGTSGFHYEHWREVFYPPELPKGRWLPFYARHFDTVELNNPFYRLPERSTFEGWASQVPPGFTFAVKASRFLTHVKRLQDPQEPLRRFFDRAVGLGETLGPVLYQLPPQMHRDLGRLEAFLDALPPGHRHVVEFRHASWYTQEVLRCETPVRATSDFVYARFHGPVGYYAGCYSPEALAEWAERLAALAVERRALYTYFNNDMHGYAVQNARQLRDLLGRALEEGRADAPGRRRCARPHPRL